MTIANYIIGCTTTVKCTTAGACCKNFSKTTGVAAESTTPVICIPAGTAVATAMPITVQTGILSTNLTSGKGFPVAACPAVVAGASTLAVTAVAAATAVYMM